jgi:seryl-tRNA synthetase
MTIIRLDQLRNEARKHSVLKDRLKEAFSLDEDDQALIDTLEGESDFRDLCAQALREVKAREAMAEGLAALINSLKARRERMEASAERVRALVAEAMLEAGEKKLAAPDMTISVRQGKPRLIIDEARLPLAYKVEKITHKVDRDAVQRAVDRGDVPQGVQIANGAPFVTISNR